MDNSEALRRSVDTHRGVVWKKMKKTNKNITFHAIVLLLLIAGIIAGYYWPLFGIVLDIAFILGLFDPSEHENK